MFKNTFQSGFLSVFYSLGSDPLQLWAKRVGPPPSSSSSSTSSSSKPKPTAASSTGDGASQSTTSSPPPLPPPEPHVEFVIDETLNSQVLELLSPNLPSTFITIPSLATRTLGIKLPILVLLIKNLGKYWSFEVTILDDRGEKRRFRASNFQLFNATNWAVRPKGTQCRIVESFGQDNVLFFDFYDTSTRVKPYITTMPLRMDPGWNQIQLNLADYTKRAYGTAYVETQRITIHANCRIRRIYFSDRLVQENDLPAEFKLYLPVVK